MHIIYLPQSERYVNLEQVALAVEEGTTISLYTAHSQVRLLTAFGTDATELRRHLRAEVSYNQHSLADMEAYYGETGTAGIDEPADGAGNPQLPARRG